MARRVKHQTTHNSIIRVSCFAEKKFVNVSHVEDQGITCDLHTEGDGVALCLAAVQAGVSDFC